MLFVASLLVAERAFAFDIDISDAAAGQLKLSFDSSWPRHTANYASVLISYDDAEPVPVFTGKASPQNRWGINARKTVENNYREDKYIKRQVKYINYSLQ